MDFVKSYFGKNKPLTSWTLLSPVFSRSALIWKKRGTKVFDWSEVHFYRSNFLQNPYFSRLIHRLKVVFFDVIDFLILNYQPFNFSTFKILNIQNSPQSIFFSFLSPHFLYLLKILPKKEIIRYILSHILNQNHPPPQVGHNNNTALCLAAPLPTTIYKDWSV